MLHSRHSPLCVRHPHHHIANDSMPLLGAENKKAYLFALYAVEERFGAYKSGKSHACQVRFQLLFDMLDNHLSIVGESACLSQ